MKKKRINKKENTSTMTPSINLNTQEPLSEDERNDILREEINRLNKELEEKKNGKMVF